MLLYDLSNPINSFVAFDKQKLIILAQSYPTYFSPIEFMVLNDQLETYIINVRSIMQFFDLKGIGDLAKRWLNKKIYCISAYLFTCTLILILPVTTAIMERTFSTINILENRLQNRMRYQCENDQLLLM